MKHATVPFLNTIFLNRKTRFQIVLLVAVCFLLSTKCFAASKADSLRGGNGVGRFWWDVKRYQLDITFNIPEKKISGCNSIRFKLKDTPSTLMQIDLQYPLQLDSAILSKVVSASATQHEHSEKIASLTFKRDNDVYWLNVGSSFIWDKTAAYEIQLYYNGAPQEAVHPPWDGGFIWTKDEQNNPWVAVACQGKGASVWFPLKDDQNDEPDEFTSITMHHPDYLKAISNGRLVSEIPPSATSPLRTTIYAVRNPINAYDITFYLGDYVLLGDFFKGEKGTMILNYFALRAHEKKAKTQFAMAPQMLNCFEHWMGPYPFTNDTYKLIEAPYLGMEHQSAIAYGNEFKMGYLGKDRSNTGIGLQFDFILVHESGHEWFGNNITAGDIADNWIHEGWTTYAECLYVECLLGKDKAFKYTKGQWAAIKNDHPIIGPYGVNQEGSDIYYKGSAVVHMIRLLINDDEKFRQLLRNLNSHFYHQTISEQQFEAYIQQFTHLDLTSFFNQYLRTTQIPQLEFENKNGHLNLRFTNTVKNFSLPITIELNGTNQKHIVSNDWSSVDFNSKQEPVFLNDFLFQVKK